MKRILLADDQQLNLTMLEGILGQEYELMFAHDGLEAVNIALETNPDLIVLDVQMPTLNGYAACLQLKSKPETRSTPVIFLTALDSEEDEARGFDVGAVDYIHKPIRPSIVRRRIANHLSLVGVRELEKTQNEAIHMLGVAGHYNDNDTGVHIWRMGAYAGAIAKAMGWSEQESSDLALAATMHDTGKIGIPDEILKAPRALTDKEWELMKSHTLIGHQILSKSNSHLFQLAAEVALNHHEKWNGTGYPNQLKYRDIPESARIVALADVFDALTMERPYKQAWSIEKALSTIIAETDEHFDGDVVKAFVGILPEIMKIRDHWNMQSGSDGHPLH